MASGSSFLGSDILHGRGSSFRLGAGLTKEEAATVSNGLSASSILTSGFPNAIVGTNSPWAMEASERA